MFKTNIKKYVKCYVLTQKGLLNCWAWMYFTYDSRFGAFAVTAWHKMFLFLAAYVPQAGRMGGLRHLEVDLRLK